MATFKRIKHSTPIERAQELLRGYDLRGCKVYVEVYSYNFGHDINGNATAHYTATLVIETPDRFINVCRIVESGKRREQVGYDGDNHKSALVALDKLGYKLERFGARNSRGYPGSAYYRITNLGE